MNKTGNHSVVEQLRSSYLLSLADKLQALETAVSVRNFKEIALYGHQLKGSGRCYGFPEVSDLGMRIEEAGLGHQGTALEALIIELSRIVERLSQDQSSSVNR